MSAIRQAKRPNATKTAWLSTMIATKPTRVSAVALANKAARTAWALLHNGGTC